MGTLTRTGLKVLTSLLSCFHKPGNEMGKLETREANEGEAGHFWGGGAKKLVKCTFDGLCGSVHECPWTVLCGMFAATWGGPPGRGSLVPCLVQAHWVGILWNAQPAFFTCPFSPFVTSLPGHKPFNTLVPSSSQ